MNAARHKGISDKWMLACLVDIALQLGSASQTSPAVRDSLGSGSTGQRQRILLALGHHDTRAVGCTCSSLDLVCNMVLDVTRSSPKDLNDMQDEGVSCPFCHEHDCMGIKDGQQNDTCSSLIELPSPRHHHGYSLQVFSCGEGDLLVLRLSVCQEPFLCTIGTVHIGKPMEQCSNGLSANPPLSLHHRRR